MQYADPSQPTTDHLIQGIAFCEFADPAATEVALQGLNNMDLGERKIRVKKASIGVTQVAGVEMGVAAMSMLAGTTSTDTDESRVLQLLNMVTADELMDNDDYEGKSSSGSRSMSHMTLTHCRNQGGHLRGVLQVR